MLVASVNVVITNTKKEKVSNQTTYITKFSKKRREGDGQRRRIKNKKIKNKKEEEEEEEEEEEAKEEEAVASWCHPCFVVVFFLFLLFYVFIYLFI